MPVLECGIAFECTQHRASIAGLMPVHSRGDCAASGVVQVLKRNQNQSTFIAPRKTTDTSNVERLEDRRLMAVNYDIGINVNSASNAAFEKSIPIMKKLGVSTVRLWHGVDAWDHKEITTPLKRAVRLSNEGFDVLMVIANDDRKVPNAADVKSWFNWAMDQDELRKAVDRWEVGNEPDLPQYWNGSLKQYVQNFLKPASEALRAHGETVVSAGVSWNPKDIEEMIGYGMLNYTDYIGFHPYANGVSLQNKRIQELKDIVRGRKPLAATEWNVRGYEKGSKTDWAKAVEHAYTNIKDNFELNYYFVLFANNSMAGPGGILKSDGSINKPFYDAFATFIKQAGGTPVVDGTPPVVDETPPVDNGNTPSGTTAQLSLYNADTDRVISGISDIKTGDVINLADLPSRKLALLVKPSANAQSVKMTLNGQTQVQSHLPYAFFGDAQNGQDLLAGDLKPGAYTMTITPYSRDHAAGAAFATRTIRFTIIDSATPGNSDNDGRANIRSYSLINAVTNQVIKGYESIIDDVTIKLSSLGTRNVALRVNADEDTQSIRVSALGRTRVENAVPYAFFGDNRGNYAGFTPHTGKYNFTATAFTQNNGQGSRGDTASIDIRFI